MFMRASAERGSRLGCAARPGYKAVRARRHQWCTTLDSRKHRSSEASPCRKLSCNKHSNDSLASFSTASCRPPRPESEWWDRQSLALRRLLLYGSSTLDIASGPRPEVNVVDMLVFVSLSRQTLENYWIPKVFGDDGLPLTAAFVMPNSVSGECPTGS